MRDFHMPTDTTLLSVSQVNLAFLNSLGTPWKLLHQALGDSTYTMKTGELFARVEAMDYTSTSYITTAPHTQTGMNIKIYERYKTGSSGSTTLNIDQRAYPYLGKL